MGAGWGCEVLPCPLHLSHLESLNQITMQHASQNSHPSLFLNSTVCMRPSLALFTSWHPHFLPVFLKHGAISLLPGTSLLIALSAASFVSGRAGVCVRSIDPTAWGVVLLNR